MATESRGDALVADAEKTLNKFSFFGSSGKKEDASEKFAAAGNAYKVSKQWDSSGEAFVRAGSLQQELGNTMESTHHFVEAAKMFRKISHDRAIEVLNEFVIPELLASGKLDQAGKWTAEIGAMHEEDSNDSAALEAYTRAADYYSSADSSANMSKCLQKVATLAAQEGDYERAVDTFISLASECSKSNLLKFNAKLHLLNAGLCIFAMGDEVRAQRALEGEFDAIAYTFAGTGEAKLLADILEAYKEGDADKFTDIIAEYDRIRKLDPFKASILLRIKRSLVKEASEAVDLT
jgi:alpha-soluble NSF attachment protein